MNARTHRSIPERVGRSLGQGWRGGVRIERCVSIWLMGQGVPKALTAVLLWTVKLACLGMLLYAAFWVALLLVVALVVVRSVSTTAIGDDESADFLGSTAELRDHRDGLFYHPASYNDDPDPRFEDD